MSDVCPRTISEPFPSASSDPLLHALGKHFGFDRFRPGQREVIEAVVAGRPVLAVMPTGAGKSLCYQLPAALARGLTVVVSPLLALMKDQVDALAQSGISTTFINSQLTPAERGERLRALSRGGFQLVYVAPERFRDRLFLDTLKQIPLSTLAVDEAHCVSQWGHDFRPDYLRIAEVARELAVPQVCAFTATATPEVRRDIVESLELHDPELFATGFRRPNLTLRVAAVAKLRHKIDCLVTLCKDTPRGSGIIYASTRKHVENVALALEERGLWVERYHAGLTEQERTAAQDKFMQGQVKVMVATNAFGMGIDKPDIRFVAHHDLPGSLEAYYQEAGRAGRDGAPAECVIFFNYVDVRIHEFFIERIGSDDEERRGAVRDALSIERQQTLERAKLRRMINYCYADGCRHETILRYFGERTSRLAPCGACDRCLEQVAEIPPAWVTQPLPRVREREATVDNKPLAAQRAGHDTPAGQPPAPPQETFPPALPSPAQFVAVQKLLSAFARGRGRVSTTRIIALCRGRTVELPEDLLASKSAGILSGVGQRVLRQMVAGLRAAGALADLPRRPGMLVLTERGQRLMMDKERFPIALPPLAQAGPRPAKAERPRPAAAGPDKDTPLFQALSAARRAIAKERGVAPFIIAHDTVLVSIANTRPRSTTELLAIKGVGPTAVDRYGACFLEIVAEQGNPTGDDPTP